MWRRCRGGTEGSWLPRRPGNEVHVLAPPLALALCPPPGSGVGGTGCSSPRSGENFATTTKVPQPIRIFTKTYLCHFVRELAMWHRGIVGGARSLLGGARRTAYAHTVLLRPEYSSAPSVSNNLRSTTSSEELGGRRTLTPCCCGRSTAAHLRSAITCALLLLREALLL